MLLGDPGLTNPNWKQDGWQYPTHPEKECDNEYCFCHQVAAREEKKNGAPR